MAGGDTNSLVFPRDLEEIEEVCCRSADLDEVFVVRRNRVGQRGHHEVERALFSRSVGQPPTQPGAEWTHLDIRLQLNSFHICGGFCIYLFRIAICD